ncbi:hypothetical protein F385_1762 [Pantoea agglomerans 299R]|nr:hypothetical protein F385_1762 [Pantoea agglomerans 299R]
MIIARINRCTGQMQNRSPLLQNLRHGKAERLSHRTTPLISGENGIE